MKPHSKLLALTVCALFLIIACGGFLHGEKQQSKLKFSFSERFRFVGWDNATNLSEETADAFSFTRHRTSLQATWLAAKDITAVVKLTNEFRYYLSPKNRKFTLHEIIFDQLYLKFKNAAGLPLTLTLGRQNIILGEGFVVMDAHPFDGSRSIYFNALRGDIRFSKGHVLTAFYAHQPTTDTTLPVLFDKEAGLIEQPETGLGLYYSGQFNNTKLEAYYIRKDIDDTEDRPVESGINTIGARVRQPLGKNLSLTAEAAYQTGTRGDVDRKALGGYFHLDYNTGDRIPLLKTVTFGGIFLSGDDPNTEEHEGWDPLFSRWPKWSESYIYTLIRENGVAYWSNVNSIYASLLMDLTRKVNFKLTYHRLGACHPSLSAFPGGTGKTRGKLLIGRLNIKIDKKWSGHFLWENFKPGSFYFDGADSYNWLRFELMFRF